MITNSTLIGFHFASLDPASRLIAMCLNYKDLKAPFKAINNKDCLQYRLHQASPWEPSLVFLNTKDGKLFDPILVIEYLDEIYRKNLLLVGSIIDRLEQRDNFRILFSDFARDITAPILYYKMCGNQYDSFPNIKSSIKTYAEYACMRLKNNDYNFICTRSEFSCVDLGFVANVSILEYLGLQFWIYVNDENLKHWYIRMKSHKFITNVISCKASNLKPASKYVDLEL